jgi:hypothetical protein
MTKKQKQQVTTSFFNSTRRGGSFKNNEPYQPHYFNNTTGKREIRSVTLGSKRLEKEVQAQKKLDAIYKHDRFWAKLGVIKHPVTRPKM